MKEDEVHAIIGPQRSAQAKFVISLGEKAQIPIISFSATSPSLSPTLNPFFIRTSQDDFSQVKAIASIVQHYGWREVVLIYEDSEYGNGLVPYLTDAFQQIDTSISYRSAISPTSSYDQRQSKIVTELSVIMKLQTRVVLVHMTGSLGSELFKVSAKMKMMSKGFAWIVTDGLSTLLYPIGIDVMDKMQGVVGVRPYVPLSKGLKDFKVRFHKEKSTSEINLFGIYAYDTVWALASATDRFVATMNSSCFRQKTRKNGSGLFGLRASELGPKLLDMLEGTKFKGLSGEFDLKGRQLQPVDYEITNMGRKRERVIGYYSSEKGIGSHDLSQLSSSVLINSSNYVENLLETIVWPGPTRTPPRGWVIPVVGRPKLKIGVPVKEAPNFEEFFKVEWDPHTNKPINFSGFSYDIFVESLKKLPFDVPYDLIPYVNGSSKRMAGTYDDLLYQIKNKRFDAVVGDTSIVAYRTSYVDFTLPYSESGVSMVVKIKDDNKKNMWIFLKPLSWELWLTTGGAFVVTGFVVWILEHRTNSEFRGPPNQQVGTIFWFSFSTLVFAHREKVMNNWSRFVLIIWIFVVLILTQSYTASLASLLTVQRLPPTVVDIDELIRNGAFVGYMKNSYIRELLIGQLNFNESKLKVYSSPVESHEALSKGSKKGGVDAIFDEIPYIKLFLAKYCSKYMMVGPTYKSDGFGFAFPIGSPLVSHISRAILNVTQDHKKMQELEQKYFGNKNKCQYQAGSTVSSDGPSLSLYSFGGLFIITGLASTCSCFIHLVKFYRKHWPAVNSIHPEGSLLYKFSEMAKYFDKRDNVPLDSLTRSSDKVSEDEVSSVIDEGVLQSDSSNFTQEIVLLETMDSGCNLSPHS
ncbi:hypothetical protein TIFTF001_035369 [Ficus carica]|uniref:Glutamate receptor n=1 Tax=Ficus carica TaxID=3494 RepID=A0AA88J6D5_FICCA|nr:hypothetical protein TIFTF001_035369 [Ficus carica]